MAKNLIVLNHLHVLNSVIGNYSKIKYAPIVKSSPQKKWFKDRFKQIKRLCPDIEYSPVSSVFDIKKEIGSEATDVLGELCFEEQSLGLNILNFNNRLFEKAPLDKTPEGFTSFRKKVEPLLPKTFQKNFAPTDEDVINKIDSYFGNVEQVKSYFETRNGLVGNSFSTKFSPYLSSGSLCVRYLYNRIKQFEEDNGANKSTYWIIFELLWREFFYWHYQKHQTSYFSKNGLHGNKDFSPIKDFDVDELRERSDIPFFLAALKEIQETGFLSNRVRQIFASIWINDLNLPWRSGALFFENYLIDYDVFSNYGNWMYLAGVGVDPRGKRYFNVEKQLTNYDPNNLYIKKWI